MNDKKGMSFMTLFGVLLQISFHSSNGVCTVRYEAHNHYETHNRTDIGIDTSNRGSSAASALVATVN